MESEPDMWRWMDDIPARRDDRFRELYRQNLEALVGYALRRVSVPADAADVVAEAFLVAWRRIDEVPPGAQARPWLFGVARRVLANHRRGDLRRGSLADRLRQDLDRHVRIDDVATTDPAAAAVRDVLDRLGEDDREILRLTTWEGLSPSEVATALEIPPATVRTRLHRARRRLRQLLQPECEGMALVAARVERSDRAGHVGAGERTLAPGHEEEP